MGERMWVPEPGPRALGSVDRGKSCFKSHILDPQLVPTRMPTGSPVFINTFEVKTLVDDAFLFSILYILALLLEPAMWQRYGEKLLYYYYCMKAIQVCVFKSHTLEKGL